MPSKRSASSQSASAPARKRVQLDADVESDGDSTPPATPTPRKRGQAASASAKKGEVGSIRRSTRARFPTARLRESLAQGQHDDGTDSDSSLSSVVVSAKPKAKVAPSVIEVSSDEEKTSKPVPKKSPTKRPQPTPVKSAASTQDAVRATPKKAPANAKVDVTVATPVKKGRASKASNSVVDPAHSDNEAGDDASSIAPAKAVASSEKSLAKPAKRTYGRAKADRSISPVARDEDEAEADDEESPARNLKRLARARVDTTAAKPVKKPRIAVNEPVEDVADSVASDANTVNEVHASQTVVEREVLGSPVQLTQDRSKEHSDAGGLFDDEAEEASDDGRVRANDEEGSEDEAEDSFINDAIDENNQPLESQNEASDDEVQQDSDAESVEEKHRAVHRSAVSKGKQKYTSPEPRASSPPITKQAPVPVKVNTNLNPNMKPECQHPDFEEYYATLGSPNLPPGVAKMHPYGWMSGQRDEEVEGLDVQAVMDGCQIDELTRFRRSVTFASYQNVFQPGRVDLRQFSSERDCVRVRLDNSKPGSSSVAVWVTTGVVNRSYLQFPYSPRSTGNDTRDARTFKIVVTPSEQERYIMDAVFGHLLRVRNYTGPVWESALSFQSQKPLADPQEDETPRSPRKSAFTKKKPIPVKTGTTKAGPSQAGSSQAGSSSSTGSFFQNLPPNRAFDDRIPVYDGRRCPSLSLKGFGFKERDWERLPELPLYEQEVEEEALVTVGYTVTGWRARNANVPSVMFNALFVVVLANPTLPA